MFIGDGMLLRWSSVCIAGDKNLIVPFDVVNRV